MSGERRRSEVDRVLGALEDDVRAAGADRAARERRTARIMGRLGYMRIAPAAARWRAARRWGGRVATAALVVVAVTVGVRLHQLGASARRPADVTIPAAIDRELLRRERGVNDVLQLFEHLLPAPATEEAPAPAPAPPTPAVGPVEWI